MQKTRLEAYTDGIFGIVATLMIFNLHLQDGIPVWRALQLELPKILVFAFSFLLLGIYWVAHHSLFHFVARSNRSLLWRNIFFLMFISFLPFPASVLGAHPYDPAAIALYATSLILINLSMFFMWHGILAHCLISQTRNDITPAIRRNLAVLQLTPVAVYLVAIAAAFFLPGISLAIFILVPLFYIVPNPVFRRMLVSDVR